MTVIWLNFQFNVLFYLAWWQVYIISKDVRPCINSQYFCCNIYHQLLVISKLQKTWFLNWITRCSLICANNYNSNFWWLVTISAGLSPCGCFTNKASKKPDHQLIEFSKNLCPNPTRFKGNTWGVGREGGKTQCETLHMSWTHNYSKKRILLTKIVHISILNSGYLTLNI